MNWYQITRYLQLCMLHTLLILCTGLKMLGLYLYTLIISHKSSKMLSILSKLILQKDLQNIVTNNLFMDKK